MNLMPEGGSAADEFFFEEQIDEVAEGVHSCPTCHHYHPSRLQTSKLQSFSFGAAQTQAFYLPGCKYLSHSSPIILFEQDRNIWFILFLGYLATRIDGY